MLHIKYIFIFQFRIVSNSFWKFLTTFFFKKCHHYHGIRITLYTINVKTELLALLVIIDFSYGKLVKTMIFITGIQKSINRNLIVFPVFTVYVVNGGAVNGGVHVNHPSLQLRAKLNYEGCSSTWSSRRLSKGAFGSHLMTHVWSQSTATVEGSVGELIPSHAPCQHSLW
jgi:hypothetical protein